MQIIITKVNYGSKPLLLCGNFLQAILNAFGFEMAFTSEGFSLKPKL